MFLQIRNKIETELASYIRGIDKLHPLSRISPVLVKSIRDFISRKGKLIRPILFTAGYLGFAKKEARGLYRSAISLELLHNFMLVHDDIIDKSPTRRGFPSMHMTLNSYLRNYRNIKFNGQDLAIIVGDILYAMALDAFLFIDESAPRKESALKKLIETAIYTGSGQFIELLYGTRKIDEIAREDIYKIYDLKTANYTFATPLCMGATLAGAGKEQLDILFDLGIYLGRAFQIHDDLIGLFGKEQKIGKSNLTDLREAKKTILIWQAYQNSSPSDKSAIKKLMEKKHIGKNDLDDMRGIMSRTRTLEYGLNEINSLVQKAESLNARSKMLPAYKNELLAYAKETLKI